MFHIDAMTGEDVAGISRDPGILAGQDIIPGALVEGYLLNDVSKIVVLFDEYLQVCNCSSEATFLTLIQTYF